MIAALLMHLGEWLSLYLCHSAREAEDHHHLPDHLHVGSCMLEIGISIHSVIIGLYI